MTYIPKKRQPPFVLGLIDAGALVAIALFIASVAVLCAVMAH